MRTYKYRNLPCRLGNEDASWSVSGIDLIGKSAGVLEWCYSHEDARSLYSAMAASGEFAELSLTEE